MKELLFLKSCYLRAQIRNGFGDFSQMHIELCRKNAMLWGASVDRVNPSASMRHYGELYGAVQQQAFMVAMQELYGWLTLLVSCACCCFW